MAKRPLNPPTIIDIALRVRRKTPAASSKSSYRKCPGGKQLGFPPMSGAGALVDRDLRFFTN
jgi:hypothetical protein